MAVDIVSFVKKFTTPGFTPTREEIGELRLAGDWIAQHYEKLEDSNQDLVVAAVKTGMESEDPRVAAMAFHITHILSGDVQYFAEALIRTLQAGGDTALMNGSMLSLGSQLFRRSLPNPDGAAVLAGRDFMHEFYSRMVRQIEAQRVEDGVHIKQGFERTGRAVVITTQLISPPHAPTVDSMKFAHYLQRSFGKETMIVNTMQISPKPDGLMIPSAHGSEQPELREAGTLTYEGEAFKYFQPTQGEFTREAIADCIRVIENFDPEIVISVGSNNMLAELFAGRAFAFRYPTDADVPLTLTNYFHTWREPTPEMLERIEIENLNGLFLFAKHPGFDTPKKFTTLTRAQYGIPEDAHVFGIVGMRLESDVDAACMDMLERILDGAPNAYFAFAGHFPGYDATMALRPKLAARCCSVGFQNDVMAFFELCNGYINPHRKGGGSAIIYAMAAGLPALSTAYGDAGEALATLPPIPTYAELADMAVTIATDPAFANEYRDKCKTAAAALTSRRPLMDMIMMAFEQYATAMEQEQASA